MAQLWYDDETPYRDKDSRSSKQLPLGRASSRDLDESASNGPSWSSLDDGGRGGNFVNAWGYYVEGAGLSEEKSAPAPKTRPPTARRPSSVPREEEFPPYDAPTGGPRRESAEARRERLEAALRSAESDVDVALLKKSRVGGASRRRRPVAEVVSVSASEIETDELREPERERKGSTHTLHVEPVAYDDDGDDAIPLLDVLRRSTEVPPAPRPPAPAPAPAPARPRAAAYPIDMPDASADIELLDEPKRPVPAPAPKPIDLESVRARRFERPASGFGPATSATRPSPNPPQKPSPPETASVRSILKSYESQEASRGLGAEYPQWFVTPGLRMLMTQNFPAAVEYYRELTRRDPRKAEGWLGLAAVEFSEGDLGSASQNLMKGYDIDCAFPIGRLIADIRPGAPQKWFDLARVLVATRKKAAYECADLILFECMRESGTNPSMRQSALKSRQAIWEALEERAARKKARAAEASETAARNNSPGRRSIGLLIGACILVAVGLAVALLSPRPNPTTRVAEQPAPASGLPAANVPPPRIVANSDNSKPKDPISSVAGAASEGGEGTLIIADADERGGSQVTVDGQPVGNTPVGLEHVDASKPHVVALTRDGKVSQKTVTVKVGETMQINF